MIPVCPSVGRSRGRTLRWPTTGTCGPGTGPWSQSCSASKSRSGRSPRDAVAKILCWRRRSTEQTKARFPAAKRMPVLAMFSPAASPTTVTFAARPPGKNAPCASFHSIFPASLRDKTGVRNARPANHNQIAGELSRLGLDPIHLARADRLHYRVRLHDGNDLNAAGSQVRETSSAAGPCRQSPHVCRRVRRINGAIAERRWTA